METIFEEMAEIVETVSTDYFSEISETFAKTDDEFELIETPVIINGGFTPEFAEKVDTFMNFVILALVLALFVLVFKILWRFFRIFF